MAITNPQAVKFSNRRARVLADYLGSAYYMAKQFMAEWQAQAMGALIPNDANEQVFDGSESDGRPLAHGDDLNNLYNRAAELVADYEAGGNAKLNTILEVASNARARYPADDVI